MVLSQGSILQRTYPVISSRRDELPKMAAKGPNGPTFFQLRDNAAQMSDTKIDTQIRPYSPISCNDSC